ncbi:MAG: hypothetical protein Q9162_004818 [Coniocarpon cinnabarinum]
MSTTAMATDEAPESSAWDSFPDTASQGDKPDGNVAWHVTDDDVKLYKKTWRLAQKDIEVHSWDQRGWGESAKDPKARGLTGGTDQVMSDITGFIKMLPQDNVPLFLYGHSMGGGQVLYWSSQERRDGDEDVRARVRGYVVESPLIKPVHWSKYFPPAWWFIRGGGRMIGKVSPKTQLEIKVDASHLTHDDAFNQEYVASPLVHNMGSFTGMSGMFDRGDDLYSGKVTPQEVGKQSILLMWGTADKVVEPEPIEQVFEKLPWQDKQSFKKMGWKHVLHSEKNIDAEGNLVEGYDSAEDLLNDLTSWVLEKTAN